MELTLLRRFYYVAREGGFTRASRATRIQQPSLSRSVRLLEEELGVVLLERGKKSVRLTRVGQQIFEASERMMQEIENVRHIAESEKNDCSGPLRFGASSSVSVAILPRVHKVFLAKYPNVWPITFSGPSSFMIERVAAGESDFAVMFHTPPVDSGIEVKSLANVRFAVVTSAKTATEMKGQVTFIGSREVDDTGTKTFPTIDRLKRDYPQVKIRISSNDLPTHKEMVLHGLGISILPYFLVHKERRKGELHDLYPKEKFQFPLNLITRKGQILSHRAKEYLGFLQEELRATP